MQTSSRIDRFFYGLYTVVIVVSGTILAVTLQRWWLLLPTLAGAALYLALALRRPLARRRAVRRRFPPAQREALMRHSPLYRHGDSALRRRLERDIQILWREFPVRGRQGEEVTDELRFLTILGVATMLLGRPEWEPPPRDGAVIYPGTRFDREYRSGRGDFSGQAPYQGPMLLTAEGIRHSYAAPHDGFQVVFHEVAHYFDWEDGQAEGIPFARLPAGADADEWQEVLAAESERARSGESVLPSYAGTNEAECFAVACEVFYERPHHLRREAPRLYALLQDFFALDPAALTPEDY